MHTLGRRRMQHSKARSERPFGRAHPPARPTYAGGGPLVVFIGWWAQATAAHPWRSPWLDEEASRTRPRPFWGNFPRTILLDRCTYGWRNNFVHVAEAATSTACGWLPLFERLAAPSRDGAPLLFLLRPAAGGAGASCHDDGGSFASLTRNDRLVVGQKRGAPLLLFKSGAPTPTSRRLDPTPSNVAIYPRVMPDNSRHYSA